jgi:hypothetical protein
VSERAVYWQRLLADWERSGLSQAEFCRRRGVKAVTFAWWKRRLSQLAQESLDGRRRGDAIGQRRGEDGGRGHGAVRRRGNPARRLPECPPPVVAVSPERRKQTCECVPGADFVEVVLPRESSSVGEGKLVAKVPLGNGYALAFPGGACLHLPADFDPERIARLVRAAAAVEANGRAADWAEGFETGSDGVCSC